MYQSKPRWTARQENFIFENWHKMSDEQIAEILGKSLKSVRRKRERMSLKKASGRGIVKAYVPKPHQGKTIAQSSEPDGTII